MNLLEAPICAKAVARLRSKGWRVGCEIRPDNRPIDAAAILNGKVLALEAKISLNKKLRSQLKRLTIRADYVLAVVGSPPRKEGINWCVKHKIGLWIVTDGPITELIPCRQLTPNNKYRIDIIKRFERWDETIVGGVPTDWESELRKMCKGESMNIVLRIPMRLGRRSIPTFRLITTATKICTHH